MPCRVFDTRSGGGQPFSGTLAPPVDVEIVPVIHPPTALAYALNATVVPQEALGYLTLWPDGVLQPLASTLNAPDGFITNNMAIVPTTIRKDRCVCVRHHATDPGHLQLLRAVNRRCRFSWLISPATYRKRGSFDAVHLFRSARA